MISSKVLRKFAVLRILPKYVSSFFEMNGSGWAWRNPHKKHHKQTFSNTGKAQSGFVNVVVKKLQQRMLFTRFYSVLYGSRRKLTSRSDVAENIVPYSTMNKT